MSSRAPTLREVTKWWPSPETKPKFGRSREGALRLSANGTRACSGAWRLRYEGGRPGAWYEVSVEVTPLDAIDLPAAERSLVPSLGKPRP